MAQQVDNGPATDDAAWTRPVPAMRHAEPVVRLVRVARRFGQQWPLRGVDLEIAPGEGVALMGRNGSGKTTLLRILATAIRPTRGTGSVAGFDLATQADGARGATGVLGHQAALYLDLTPRENLEFALRMLGLAVDRSAIDAAIARVGLADHADERVRHFSAGMTRRVALARLLLRPHALLLLDEPYASFDAEGIQLLDEIAAEARARGAAVVVASHDPVRARGMADRAVRIEQGLLHELPWPMTVPGSAPSQGAVA